MFLLTKGKTRKLFKWKTSVSQYLRERSEKNFYLRCAICHLIKFLRRSNDFSWVVLAKHRQLLSIFCTDKFFYCFVNTYEYDTRYPQSFCMVIWGARKEPLRITQNFLPFCIQRAVGSLHLQGRSSWGHKLGDTFILTMK